MIYTRAFFFIFCLDTKNETKKVKKTLMLSRKDFRASSLDGKGALSIPGKSILVLTCPT